MSNYRYNSAGTWKVDPRAEMDGDLLANFTAQITKETQYIDGQNCETILTIEGECDEKPLPPIDVPSDSFPSMSWVTRAWGIRCVITPGQGIKDDLRAAIQMRSRTATREIVHQAIGWNEAPHAQTEYLHAKGSLRETGNDPNTRVELPPELHAYDLTPTEIAPQTALQSLLTLTTVAPRPVAYTSLAAAIRATTGPADFGIHITGRSGTYKSELASLFQACFGHGFTARKLPGNWSSTANALEALAYRAKNALFVIDDYIPVGTSWHIKQYAKTADQLIRGQGNQAGRARLTDTSRMQATMYPRGIIYSTGEDTPEGHSLRGRLMILELTRGDIDTAKLTACQQLRGIYATAFAHWIMWQCKHREHVKTTMPQIAAMVRDQNLGVGHSRTPTMVGELVAAFEMFLAYARDQELITQKQRDDHAYYAREAIEYAAQKQQQYLQDADPATVFVTSLNAALASKKCYISTMKGGEPEYANLLGWTEDPTETVIIRHRAHGTKIGWIDRTAGVIYLDTNHCFEEVRKASGGQITLTKQTMFKRLKESGYIAQIDDARGRNTIRVTVEGVVKTCLALKVSEVLDLPVIEEPEF